jgi:cellulose synthase/poly-beta-1,6-N-acetylglucosamine synthase-like glycosyltransferase
MGRVVPLNSDANLLTRLLDLERRAGYAVDQNGRALWNLMPQFGGTVGGIRRAALESVGGWKMGHLAEDTDLTFRLALGGWRIAYLNEARCYEEVPEDWLSRFRQVRRWAYGHNECLLSYWVEVLRSRWLRPAMKLDAALILLFYLFPTCALVSTIATIPLLAFGAEHSLLGDAWGWIGWLMAIAVLAPYAQIAVAADADRQRHILRALPLLPVSSSLSLLAATAGLALLVRSRLGGLSLGWDKTRRYRSA